MAAGGVSLLLATTGCGAFFQCEGKADCGTSGPGTGTGSGDYVYVSNSVSGIGYLDAYDVSSGALTALSGAPYNLSYEPVALSISPKNNFLYIATASTVSYGIYLYSIASSGVPSIQNSGAIMGSVGPIASMDISADGNWLYTIELSSLGTYILQQYSINTSTGLLTLSASFPLPTASCGLVSSASTPATQRCTVKVSPSEEYVISALGTAGDAIYPYSPGSGITSNSYSGTIPALSSISGELSVAIDASNYAYIAQTASISVYSILSTGVPATQINNVAQPVAAPYVFSNNETPRSITLSKTDTYVYTADQGTNMISAFSTSTGMLTSLGAEVSGPNAVSVLGADNSGKYLVAAGYDTASGIQLFTIQSGGTISNLDQNAGTGTSFAYPTVMALTH
jgi:6-phosphogluconolactonase